jgi:chorismate synthase
MMVGTLRLAHPTPVIPAHAGIQYAAAFRFHDWRLGILVRPLSRTMTAERVAHSYFAEDSVLKGCHNSGAVIASEAKQSISRRKGRMDCFASLAMTLI